MEKIIAMIVNIIMFCTTNVSSAVMASIDDDYTITMKQDILALMVAYPETIKDVVVKDNKVYCITSNNKEILYDDKKEKSHDEKLSNADLQDALEQVYPLEMITSISPTNFEPGRIRCYPLLNEIYGYDQNSIEKNLTSLKYGYTNYRFNSKANANINLENALKVVMPLANSRSDIASILYPASGTYNYRTISGTGRLSPHAYAIAIDLKTDSRDYWKWTNAQQGLKRILEYPEDLVKAFENNYFVWGGKWNHFDTLHFEYRPEIILKAKYFTNYEKGTPWYTGAPETEEVKAYIEIIENSLKAR